MSEIKKGYRFVHSGGWVKVMNPEGIGNCNIDFKFGEDGCILRGTPCLVMAGTAERCLVRVEKAVRAAGTRLPSGTLFWSSEEEIRKGRERMEEEERARVAGIKEVEEALEAARKEKP